MIRWQLAQKLEIRWWQWYLKERKPAEYLLQKKAYWNRILDQADLSLGLRSSCLDVGCGPAGIFLVLDKQQVTAIDPLLDQYAQKLDHFAKADYPWTRFHALALEDWTPTEKYDYIFCLNAINHVADWEKGLDRLQEAAQAGTRLLLGVDVHRYYFLQKIFRFLPGDLLHPHQHMQAHYLQALRQRKWQIHTSLISKPGRIFDYWLVVAEMM